MEIKEYVREHLLSSFKGNSNILQETMVELIAQKLELLYGYTYLYPEIVTPNSSRMDIVRAIAEQFSFIIREEANIEEQLDILDHILYVYNRRGSVDSIENMWRYYGGDLPKKVEVSIPSYRLFRYNISKLSGNHVYQDATGKYRTGVYEINVYDNETDVTSLKEFLLRELVAAGNEIYIKNIIHLDSLSDMLDTNPYIYKVATRNKLSINLMKMLDEGVTIDSIDKGNGTQDLNITGDVTLSSLDKGDGTQDFIINAIRKGILDFLYEPTLYFSLLLESIPDKYNYKLENYLDPDGNLGFYRITGPLFREVKYYTTINTKNVLDFHPLLYCTPESNSLQITRYSYNAQGELITSDYPGYFILSETKLSEEVK